MVKWPPIFSLTMVSKIVPNGNLSTWRSVISITITTNGIIVDSMSAMIYNCDAVARLIDKFLVIIAVSGYFIMM